MAEEKKLKGPRKMERHFKGVSNHRRIQILMLISKKPDITLEDIANTVHGNVKTIADHTRRLVLAGLVEKTHAGRSVQHKLTPYGRKFNDFLTDFART
jgi:DNA-binding MarR family transcriptional regulator